MSDGSDQKLNIANYFISSSPTGEVDDVVTGKNMVEEYTQLLT